MIDINLCYGNTKCENSWNSVHWYWATLSTKYLSHTHRHIDIQKDRVKSKVFPERVKSCSGQWKTCKSHQKLEVENLHETNNFFYLYRIYLKITYIRKNLNRTYFVNYNFFCVINPWRTDWKKCFCFTFK